jgi:hypothetical protein
MSRIKGSFTRIIDQQTVRLLAAVGKTKMEAAKFLGLSLRTFLYRFSDEKISGAWKTGRELFCSVQKTVHGKMPDIFKTKDYISRRISKNPSDVVNIFAVALMNVFTENNYSLDGISFDEIVKAQLLHFAERTRKNELRQP